MSDGKKKILSALLVIAAAVLVIVLGGDFSIMLQFDEEYFTVDGPEGYVFRIPLGEIEDASLAEEFDRGQCAEGGEKRRYSYGIWENANGRYQLCVLDKVNRFISLRQTDGTVTVLNFESDESTENLFQLINDVLLSRQEG